jgi:hypothetical protein
LRGAGYELRVTGCELRGVGVMIADLGLWISDLRNPVDFKNRNLGTKANNSYA